MKLIVDHLTHKYNEGTNQLVTALEDINLVINPGEFIGLIGHTGSGKSTLIQHMNGLLTPSSGTIYFEGEDIFDKDYDKKKLRSKVGLVFQYPEHQLFEETVFADVCFGPKNMGYDKNEAGLKAYEALKLVGVSEEYYYQSPFDLSGGQKRKVAIAGVLAMRPEILILDEPTAGLDPKGREEILDCINGFREKEGMSIVLVSHSMEDVANYADRIVVLNKGHILYDDTCDKVFSHYNELEAIGLRAPEVTYIMQELKKNGFDVNENVTTIAEAKESILNSILKNNV